MPKKSCFSKNYRKIDGKNSKEKKVPKKKLRKKLRKQNDGKTIKNLQKLKKKSKQ